MAEPEGDWASETADKLEQLVEKVRSQTTDRLVAVARILVFGLLAAVMGIMAAILALAGLVHFLDDMIPREVWLTYMILGAILTSAGLFLWSKKDRRPSEAQ